MNIKQLRSQILQIATATMFLNIFYVPTTSIFNSYFTMRSKIKSRHINQNKSKLITPTYLIFFKFAKGIIKYLLDAQFCLKYLVSLRKLLRPDNAMCLSCQDVGISRLLYLSISYASHLVSKVSRPQHILEQIIRSSRAFYCSS